GSRLLRGLLGGGLLGRLLGGRLLRRRLLRGRLLGGLLRRLAGALGGLRGGGLEVLLVDLLVAQALRLDAEHAHEGDGVERVIGERRDDLPRARRRFGLDLVQCLVLGGAGVGDLGWHGSSWLVAGW